MIEGEIHRLRSKESRGLDSRILTTTLAPELVRAVSALRIMERFGYHLRKGYLDGTEQVDKLYDLTHQVKRYDFFVSHDWASRRFQKLLALCAYNNLVPAVIVSFVISVGAMVLEIVCELPSMGTRAIVVEKQVFKGNIGRWPLLLGPVTYLVTFFFWQRIRLCLSLRVADVFFDRFCVHQTDENLKAAAILGLGGFLDRSNTLVILWSPRYFTRLWCVYEVATWTFLQKPDNKIILIPIQIVERLLAAQCVCFGAALYSTMWVNGDKVSLIVTGLVIAVVATLQTKFMTDIFKDWRTIQQQLTSFRVDTATCFCCTVNHRNNNSGMEVQCDRKLVCNTIGKWFATNVGLPNERYQASQGVEKFESYVTGLLAEKIMHRISGRLPTLTFVALILYPWFWMTCSDISFLVTVGDIPGKWKLFLNLFGYLLVFLALPTRFTFLFSRWMTEELPSWGRCLRLLRRTGIFVITYSVWLLSMGLPLYLRTQLESVVPSIIVFCLLACIMTVLCRMHAFDGSHRRQVGGALEETSTEHGFEAPRAANIGRQPNPGSNEPARIVGQGSEEFRFWYL